MEALERKLSHEALTFLNQAYEQLGSRDQSSGKAEEAVPEANESTSETSASLPADPPPEEKQKKGWGATFASWFGFGSSADGKDEDSQVTEVCFVGCAPLACVMAVSRMMCVPSMKLLTTRNTAAPLAKWP